MKALIYKEFKLAMHPMCYLFIVLFPFMVLIPVYPLGISFIYILTCYPVLFLGANKGQQSNDLLYSTLLPVRKKDIVLARIITVLFMQVASMLIVSALYPLALLINQSMADAAAAARAAGQMAEDPVNAGLTLNSFVLVLAFAVLGYPDLLQAWKVDCHVHSLHYHWIRLIYRYLHHRASLCPRMRDLE